MKPLRAGNGERCLLRFAIAKPPLEAWLHLLGYSAWVTTTFTTDTFSCLPPDDLVIASLANQSATFTWTADGPCRLRVWTADGQEWTFADAQSPFTLNNLESDHTYYATVSSYCGSQRQIVGSWGDMIDFTISCQPVTGLHTGDITSHSIFVMWDSTENTQSYLLQYGPHPYSLVEGTDTVVTGNSCLIDGLAAHTAYDIYVRTRCGEDWYAEDYTSITGVVTSRGEAIDLVTSTDICLIYPNPCLGFMNLYGPTEQIKTVTLYDMTGREVYRHTKSVSLNTNPTDQGPCYSLNISYLPQGCYIAQIETTRGTTQHLKLIKK